MSAYSIRDADLSRDTPAMLAFIMGSQRFEHAFEPNRRLDLPVAAEHLAVMQKLVAEHDGRIFIAANGKGDAIGWAVAGESTDDVYVIAEERRYLYIAELFVNETLRGEGIGRALIAACENLARERGIAVMQIGVLPGNARAHAIYQQAGYADYGIQLRKYLR